MIKKPNQLNYHLIESKSSFHSDTDAAAAAAAAGAAASAASAASAACIYYAVIGGRW